MVLVYIVNEILNNFKRRGENLIVVYRIGETYFCEERLVEKDKIEFSNFFFGESIGPYELLCKYLNQSDNIDLKKWNEIIDPNDIFRGRNRFTTEFQQDFITSKRLYKIRRIKTDT
jgi:hypothetical protein